MLGNTNKINVIKINFVLICFHEERKIAYCINNKFSVNSDEKRISI